MLHFVNCSARPSGPTSVAQVERIFTAKLAAAASARTYDSFFDYSLALWTSSLDPYVDSLKIGGVAWLPLVWQDERGGSYYSLLVHQPGTQSVIELITTAVPMSLPAEELVSHGAVRYPSSLFVGMNVSTSSPPRLLTPLAVSKATSNLLAPRVEARAAAGPA